MSLIHKLIIILWHVNKYKDKMRTRQTEDLTNRPRPRSTIQRNRKRIPIILSPPNDRLNIANDMRAAMIVLLDKYAVAEENHVPDMFTESNYIHALQDTNSPSWWHLKLAAMRGTQHLLSVLNLDHDQDASFAYSRSCSLLSGTI